MPNKLTYKLSSCTGRDPQSVANNKECQIIDLHPVKLHRQRSTVSGKQQRMSNKLTYSLSNCTGRDPVSGKQQRMSNKLTYILSSCTGRDPQSVTHNKECQIIHLH